MQVYTVANTARIYANNISIHAGAKIVGANCHFDPTKLLDCVELMKEGLVKANLYKDTYLMIQPLGYHTPDAGKQGFIDLPEFPFGE